MRKFPKRRPTFLINPQTSERLELDGYNKELRYAFEYNGRQHYEYIQWFHGNYSDFKEQQDQDCIKRRICHGNKIKLLIVPYDIIDIEAYILSWLIDNGFVLQITSLNTTLNVFMN